MFQNLIEKLNSLMASKGNPPVYISGPTKPELIEKVEDRLKVKLPDDYKRFLLTYGIIGMGDDEVFGMNGTEDISQQMLVRITEGNREEINLPHSFIPINRSEYGDFICLNTGSVDNHRLVYYSSLDETFDSYPHANSFEEYLESYLKNYILVNEKK